METDQHPVRKDGKDMFLRCHYCGAKLPFLHPHIMVEKHDEDGNLVCDDCYSDCAVDS